MKFIWSVKSSVEEIKELIKNKNKNCSECLEDILVSLLNYYDGLSMDDIFIKPWNYDDEIDSMVYLVMGFQSKNPMLLCYLIQV